MSNIMGTLFDGPVFCLAKVIKNAMASAAEAELGALFMNTKEAVATRNCLEAKHLVSENETFSVLPRASFAAGELQTTLCS